MTLQKYQIINLKMILKIIKSFLLFLYIFEFNLAGWGFPTYVTSRRIAILGFIFLFMVINIISRGKRFTFRIPPLFKFKYLKWTIWYNFLLLIYACVIFVCIGGTGDYFHDCIMRLILFGLIPCLIIYNVYESLSEFFDTVIYAITFQSLIIGACLYSSDFANMIDSYFAASESVNEYVVGHRGGYAGGIACITAPGLLKFSIGYVACIYKYLQTRNFSFLLIYFVYAVIGTMIARTGLLISVVCIFWLYKSTGTFKDIFRLSLFSAFAFVLLIVVIIYFDLGDFFLTRFKRFEQFEYGLDYAFFNAYFQTNDLYRAYLPLDSISLLGTDIISGYSNAGYYISVDGEILRLYCAIGIPLCAISLLLMYLMFFDIIKNTSSLAKKVSIQAYVIIIFLGQIKELMIYQQYPLFLLFGIFFLDDYLDKKTLNLR